MKRRRDTVQRGTIVRSGSSLVEVLVAIIILGVATSGLAAMALQAGRTSAASESSALRDAALHTAIDRVAVQPYDGLNELAGCSERGEGHFAYLLCVRVEEEETNLSAVTVLVDPESETVPSVSTVLLRSRTPPPTPF